jgi:putative membrane protein
VRNFTIRLGINAVALALTAALLPGIHIGDDGVLTLLLVALIFGVLNAIVKPVLLVLSCPLIILTLGFFFLVVNGLMLMLTDALAGNRFTVDGFWWAVLGGLIIGVLNAILESAVGLDEDQKEAIVIIRS